VKPAPFSSNSESACPTCNGAGVIYTNLGIMDGVSTICEDSDGQRFQAAVLEYQLGGLDIGQVLDLPVEDALGRACRAFVAHCRSLSPRRCRSSGSRSRAKRGRRSPPQADAGNPRAARSAAGRG
jgi:hypothetical protein